MQRRATQHRSGLAAVAVIVVLILLDLILVGIVLGVGRDHHLTIRRAETVSAFYASEAGINMSMREMWNRIDEDGDGEIGTVSDDGDDATDPVVGDARVVVTATTGGGQVTLISEGRSGEAHRSTTAVVTDPAL